ncbi:preprotein translocase subunit SecG [Candidatus Falkowbacteria bacterium RIFOXYD2_FULL_35_9]|uniref:Protein-export membrane protein SecG n=1 Tax=Candidatus Falkowbacteria bacterium RIFOXYC2_FULL_36_12 TaxID=1798002 RepID=A0A1F5T2W2_9BACT|nr:MAG: preprotein translocase subunit SecG [Candidatus Falkowbacteria bacterium RIFOXYB2_FULL_35_7]OGF33307.1 MAG: preprotein translocase subunit SecG [Candidatus Falkowbacteria bacterium RIFOXYC2_FULL_36_12]OGF34857.1 MAG: preprotein translocase subunit SecG [Candidatus Falkowbacteria bacterium RIFOXYA2_FULL_35_8]OGF48570.1 MAG: preprotein translocase subunit SecG [Candidatus Falkowbacteria bacterium RIFOXYD2_FULL_35_9]
MDQIIIIIQMVVAVLLIIFILLQNRGSGAGGIFGGAGGGSFRSKRGLDKKLHILTIIFSILFLGLSIANLLF